MSIKSDKWIQRQCTPPDGLWGMGYSKLPINKIGDNWYIRENGIPLVMRDGSRVEDNEEFTPISDEQKAQFKPMIEPFEPNQIKYQTDQFPSSTGEDDTPRRIVSYGTSSYGYDVRLATKFKIFTNINSAIIDPLNMSDDCYVDFEGEMCIIPPNSYVLGHTVEYFRMPRNVTAICVGKSTYARAGCAVNITPIEAGFEGQVVLEIANLTPLPMKIHAGMGIAQFLFYQGDEQCEVSYADRAG